MKTCPTCGNKYRPDIDVCPNDGTALPAFAAPPAAAAPPPGAAPPSAATPTPAARAKPIQAPTNRSYADLPTLTEHSTASSWVIAIVMCGVIVGGYFVARDFLLPKPPGDDPTVAVDDGKPTKKKRKRKRSKKNRNAPKPGDPSYDDYDWEQDFAEDDLVLGDIASQRDEIYEEAVEVREPEPYNPKPNEWQASGSYRPTASWSEPGAKTNVVEIDLTAPSNASPLDESQVKQVLSVRKLASCYDPWVQKIPQMRGRVDMDFVVAADGHVAAVEITRSQLRSKVVEACIVSKARTFRFPRAQGGSKTRFDTHFDFTNR